MPKLFERDWTRQELIWHTGQMDQLAGIRLLEAADGNGRGSRLLQVWNGSGLSFNVLAERAMDISACTFKGIPLAWQSPVGDAHPAYYEPAGVGWLRTFQGGLLVTCGLDTFGPPVMEGDQELGQHGRISNLPARAVGVQAGWEGEEYRLEVHGEVRQARVFGENLLLRRSISTSLGSHTIRIEDTVSNQGFSPQAHMLMYHINTGFPLLDESADLKFDVLETLPEDEASAKALADWRSMQPPTPDYQEQNFVHAPLVDANGWACAELHNPRLKLGFRVHFEAGALPWLNEWKMMGAGLYVLAIEPMNCNPLGGRADLRARQALPILAPGESRRYALELEIVEYDDEKDD